MQRSLSSWWLLPLLGSTLVAGAARAETPACFDFAACTRVCELARSGADCFTLGLRFQQGTAGLPQNDTQAGYFYRRACDRGVAAGCTNYGYYLYWGKAGLTLDKARGAALYRKGCDGGDHVGCNNLGSAYAFGSGAPLDLEAAIRLFRRACAGGVQLGCKNARDAEARRAGAPAPGGPGIVEKRDPPPPPPPPPGGIREKDAAPAGTEVRAMPVRALESPVAAAERLGRACAPSQPAACFELALLQLQSWGVPLRAAEAARLLGQACDNGHGDACARLAGLVGDGILVPKDVPRSVELLQRGCAAQSGRACRGLASLHVYGDRRQGGMAQRDAALGRRLLAQAAAHLRRECDEADARACGALADMVWGGEGVPRDAAGSRGLLQRACDGGDLEGCVTLGYAYTAGQRLAPVDAARGATLYRRACDGGLAVGCTRLATAYRNGAGVVRDLHRSRELLRRACPKDAYACWSLGKAWEVGPDGARDDARATAAFREGCDAGDSSCCDALKRMKVETSTASEALKACDAGRALRCLEYGTMLKNGRGVSQDASSAVGFYMRACEGGVAPGCVLLGLLLKLGATGLSPDPVGATEAYKRAVPILTKECHGKKTESCADLAELYCDGSMLPQDPRKVLALLERGCGRKHWRTCNRLGATLLRGGCGLQIKPDKAVAIIGKACESGDEAACDALVYGYAEGFHLKKDPAQALRWMVKACDKGMGRFCQRLGAAHEWGEQGAPKDLMRALLFYKRACDKGVSYGCARQKTLGERLSK